MIFWSIFACTPEFSDPTIEFFNPNLVVVGSEIPVTVTGTNSYVHTSGKMKSKKKSG